MSAKDITVNFLKLVTDGKIDEAYDKYVDMSGRHHNLATPAGMNALKQGMHDAEIQFPNKSYSVKLALDDGPIAAVYGQLTLSNRNNDLTMATVHICRVKEGKIIEFWDCSQNLPDTPVNTDGPF